MLQPAAAKPPHLLPMARPRSRPRPLHPTPRQTALHRDRHALDGCTWHWELAATAPSLYSLKVTAAELACAVNVSSVGWRCVALCVDQLQAGRQGCIAASSGSCWHGADATAAHPKNRHRQRAPRAAAARSRPAGGSARRWRPPGRPATPAAPPPASAARRAHRHCRFQAHACGHACTTGGVRRTA